MQGTFANPEKITTHFHLREGDVIADLGAGSGQYMKPLSDAVGKSGKVYLCEIQKPLVESLGNRAQELRLSNVRTLWADLEHPDGVKVRDQELDAALLSNVLFQIEDKNAAISEIMRILRPGGKLFIIDWTDSFGGLGPRALDVVSEASTRSLFERAGFTFLSDFPAGDHHYGMTFRKN